MAPANCRRALHRPRADVLPSLPLLMLLLLLPVLLLVVPLLLPLPCLVPLPPARRTDGAGVLGGSSVTASNTRPSSVLTASTRMASLVAETRM